MDKNDSCAPARMPSADLRMAARRPRVHSVGALGGRQKEISAIERGVLAEDVSNLPLHGVGLGAELARDLAIGPSLHEVRQHLALAIRQRLLRRRQEASVTCL